mmetsp:Transcript_29024/g.85896  ORF Transcript_29024/g.85896 Transcript_29024/m.85896 type:complete len:159 (+) Transcript_29024:869-1345(+)
MVLLEGGKGERGGSNVEFLPPFFSNLLPFFVLKCTESSPILLNLSSHNTENGDILEKSTLYCGLLLSQSPRLTNETHSPLTSSNHTRIGCNAPGLIVQNAVITRARTMVVPLYGIVLDAPLSLHTTVFLAPGMKDIRHRLARGMHNNPSDCFQHCNSD